VPRCKYQIKERIKIITITEAEIKSKIHSLKPKKSSGYDEITSKTLKACASFIGHPLSYIYNHSLYASILPGRLKIAVAKSLYKKGDKTGMKNSRFISLLTIRSTY
jgi:hypothetical protein